uniref:Uncharacterized protein n=1 Tax=Zonotrichia albicollis TaxID=44394 RepID=A0A8D2N5M3_ZONAL
RRNEELLTSPLLHRCLVRRHHLENWSVLVAAGRAVPPLGVLILHTPLGCTPPQEPIEGSWRLSTALNGLWMEPMACCLFVLDAL